MWDGPYTLSSKQGNVANICGNYQITPPTTNSHPNKVNLVEIFQPRILSLKFNTNYYLAFKLDFVRKLDLIYANMCEYVAFDRCQYRIIKVDSLLF